MIEIVKCNVDTGNGTTRQGDSSDYNENDDSNNGKMEVITGTFNTDRILMMIMIITQK